MPLVKVSSYLTGSQYMEVVTRAVDSGRSVSMVVVSILTGQEEPIRGDDGEREWSKHRQAKSKENTSAI